MKNEDRDQLIMYSIGACIALFILANTWYVVTGVLTFIGAVAVHEWYRNNHK